LTAAYIDTSCVVAAAFGEPAGARIVARLSRFERVLSSPLLEAELWSALTREGRQVTDAYSAAIEFIVVDRPLSVEIRRVLDAGYVRGADCWHLATALYLAPMPGELTFLTLDDRQRRVAKALGFPT
jgi:predicted nucleic acid-binding protein